MLLYVPLKAYSPTTLGSTPIYYMFDFCYYIKILFASQIIIKKNLKNKLVHFSDKLLLRKRAFIEHSHHCSVELFK